MKFLPGFLRGGDDELGWDDLIRRTVKTIGSLAHRGARGRTVFPSDVTVRIAVPIGRLDVMRQFVSKPELDAEVAAGLVNLTDCAVEDLPERDYVVEAADGTSVVASESKPKAWQVRIEGGDLDGSIVELPTSRSELRFGRGRFHGADQSLPNDLVVCERTEFVSRRAGRIVPRGSTMEIESLDQGDAMMVRRTTGEAIRPARTAKGRVPIRTGDAVEIIDPRGSSIRLSFQRKTLEEGSNRGSDHA